jgi:hypothetical protein
LGRLRAVTCTVSDPGRNCCSGEEVHGKCRCQSAGESEEALLRESGTAIPADTVPRQVGLPMNT